MHLKNNIQNNQPASEPKFDFQASISDSNDSGPKNVKAANGFMFFGKVEAGKDVLAQAN